MTDLTNVINVINLNRAARAVQDAHDSEASTDREPYMLRGFKERCTRGNVPLSVVKQGTPRYFRLCYDGDAREEVVLSASGILIHSDFCPKDLSMKTNSARYAKRGLSMSGFGNYEFDQMTTDVAFIHDQFVRSGIGLIEAQYSSEFRDMYMIGASNNYFTPKHLIPYETYRPYPPQEDPFGALHRCAESTASRNPVVRLKENDVEYYRKVVGEGGKLSMEPCSPDIFRPGDVVQIQVSFIAFQLRSQKNKFKMYGVRTVLRSVALMDTSVRKEAEDREFIEPKSYLAPPLRLERKVGYGNEHAELPKRMAGMTLSEVSNVCVKKLAL